jgi:hypothetical protein
VATIASLLTEHVALKLRSVDRVFLQGYVPRLMSAGLVCRFLLDRGCTIPRRCCWDGSARASWRRSSAMRAGGRSRWCGL